MTWTKERPAIAKSVWKSPHRFPTRSLRAIGTLAAKANLRVRRVNCVRVPMLYWVHASTASRAAAQWSISARKGLAIMAI